MTNYSMALDRLRRETSERPTATLEEHEPAIPDSAQDNEASLLEPARRRSAGRSLREIVEHPAEERSQSPRAGVFDALPFLSAAQREAHAGLLDAIRSIRQIRGEVPCVVLCGVSRAEAVDRIIGGLVEAGAGRGLHVVALELATTHSGRQLRPHPVNGLGSPIADLAPFELSTPRQTQEVGAWLSDGGVRVDVVIVEGPALSDSADAALLGRVLDGLFVVVEQGRTRSDLLTTAAQRAR
ncbi:MAG TPA: hypothetical protein VMT85_14795, partial [Thermoanaerobaculia bacterium]|nr:hypothetical protein [Thermoanaerobaculia bacterium]